MEATTGVEKFCECCYFAGRVSGSHPKEDSTKKYPDGTGVPSCETQNLRVKSKMLRSVTSIAAFICLTSVVIAHEGHGHPEHQQGATHYLVNPSHALPVLFSVAAIAGIGFLISRSVRKWRS